MGHKLGLDEIGQLLREKTKGLTLDSPVKVTWPTHPDKCTILKALVDRETLIDLKDSKRWSPFTIRYNDVRGTAWVKSCRIDGPGGHFSIKGLRNEIDKEEYI